jgi:copper(I)-binding protein
MKRIPATLCTLLLALAMCSGAANGGDDAISVTGAYVRAVPPGQANSAAFMGLVNGSGEDRALIGAESTGAEVVELHTHVAEDGMMKMRRLQRIELPAGRTVSLAPGGLHIMLIGLKERLDPGRQIDLSLVLDDGTRLELQAPVRKVSVESGGTGMKGRCGGGRCGEGRCGSSK